MNRFVILIFAICLPATHLIADEANDVQRLDFFEEKIRPVLVKHCYQCHSPKSDSVKGGLLLDSREGMRKGGESGPAVVPSSLDESLLISALKYEDYEMPPKGKLPDEVVKDFERWIREGATDPRDQPAAKMKRQINFDEAAKFWAFQSPRLPEIPQLNDAWIRNDIDRFVLAQLREQGLKPNPPADPSTLLRRAYFNLIGLPPTPGQADKFEVAAFDSTVNELLASQHYGERWARHWLDVARYGEDQAHTFKARKYPRGYLYRDWVVKSFNDDLPYNQFLVHQIAGDLLPESNKHKRLAALGLFALGPVYYAENVEKSKAQADEWDDRIDTLMRGVLGLTVSCARCHDHKYDPLTVQDYYGLAGVFASTKYQERPIASPEIQAKREAADTEARLQQVAIDRYLAEQSRALRDVLVDDVPAYVVAVWKFNQRSMKEKNAKNSKKLYSQIAKEDKLSPTLIERWVNYLQGEPRDDEQPIISGWKKLTERQDVTEEQASEVGVDIQKLIRAKVDRRQELFARFGDNAAFVKASDTVKVKPGVIPLGNFFDDTKNVTLTAALSTDRFKATASDKSFGVDRVRQGWGKTVEIAPKVSFHFDKLGSDNNGYGAITNDGWNTDGGIRTTGRRASSNLGRTEQGIGMHANALITFDLDAIRRAGLMPVDQKFVFKVDRAGVNDDVISSQASTHVAVIVSRPSTAGETNSILSAHVNGKSMELATDDFTFYFAGEIPKPLLSDGKYVSFDVPIPAEAKHLTLVTTGAGGPDENPISSDHTVFSGVRLEMDPLPKVEVAENKTTKENENADQRERDRLDAIVLSRFFYDEGLLAATIKETEGHLTGEPKKKLATMRADLDRLNRAAAAIIVDKAHSLTEDGSRDIKVYLQGNPANQGDVAERAMPAIFTGGVKKPFKPQGSGRLELAKAIATSENPLTARVIVNRVWAGHFGHGLVRTPSNFGKLGERPTHPNVLDYLTVKFIENDWSLKWLHRTIMASATFQQSSRFNATNYEADPENRLLWRMNRRRLEIEAWRDAMLATSGELDAKLGGPSMNLGDNNNKRRTLYGSVSRHRLDELLRLFDFPDPNITAGQRTVTTVPLQQLFVLNSDFMINRARALASRVEQSVSGDDAEKIKYAHELLYGRSASADEIALAAEFLTSALGEGDRISCWEQYALALLSANEFMWLD
jgi:hypothetical protein